MKKFISLVLVLVLSLTAVSAFAEDPFSPNTVEAFAVSTETAESATEGVSTEPAAQESKDLVNEVVESGNLEEKVYEKTIFVDENGAQIANPVAEKNLTTVVIVPAPAIEVETDVQEKFAEIKVEDVPEAVTEFLTANKSNIIVIFTYQVGEQFYSHVIDFTVSENTITYQIPVEVLKAAEGHPSFFDIKFAA